MLRNVVPDLVEVGDIAYVHDHLSHVFKIRSCLFKQGLYVFECPFGLTPYVSWSNDLSFLAVPLMRIWVRSSK